jgi:predicted metal-dependent HD superfamily phosphohydrolase
MAESMVRADPQGAVSDASVFSLFYHDIVYRPLRGDNEEQSARIARQRLGSLGLTGDIIALCEKMILATKKHLFADHASINAFLDADLAILGATPDLYHRYSINVRKEFGAIPDFVYKPGRKKVLRHFLSMASIYKTPYFQNHYEAQARNNMENELDDLSR